MIFKRKESFFLDLGAGESTGEAGAAQTSPGVAVAVQPPAAVAAPATAAKGATKPAATPAEAPQAAATAAAAAPAKPMLTTAEAIAAELRAAQEARPAPSSATFAPNCLNPANAVPQPRRKAGANLAGFKAMAAEMFRS